MKNRSQLMFLAALSYGALKAELNFNLVRNTKNQPIESSLVQESSKTTAQESADILTPEQKAQIEKIKAQHNAYLKKLKTVQASLSVGASLVSYATSFALFGKYTKNKLAANDKYETPVLTDSVHNGLTTGTCAMLKSCIKEVLACKAEQAQAKAVAAIQAIATTADTKNVQAYLNIESNLANYGLELAEEFMEEAGEWAGNWREWQDKDAALTLGAKSLSKFMHTAGAVTLAQSEILADKYPELGKALPLKQIATLGKFGFSPTWLIKPELKIKNTANKNRAELRAPTKNANETENNDGLYVSIARNGYPKTANSFTAVPHHARNMKLIGKLFGKSSRSLAVYLVEKGLKALDDKCPNLSQKVNPQVKRGLRATVLAFAYGFIPGFCGKMAASKLVV